MSYREEFPKFDPATMPALPAEWLDNSWHNDTMPHFDHAECPLSIWIDYLDPADREHQEGCRFSVYRLDGDGQFADDGLPVLQTDDWSAVLTLVNEQIEEIQKHCHHRSDSRGRCIDCGAFIEE
jgi:hypothetical protein